MRDSHIIGALTEINYYSLRAKKIGISSKFQLFIETLYKFLLFNIALAHYFISWL